jgi:hypothetical protein
MNVIEKYKSFRFHQETTLVVLLLLMSLLYNYLEVFTKGPYSIHMWRQTDCLGLTQGYYQDNAPFLEPRMPLQVGGTGRCVSEFPVFYYITAQYWRWFGKSEMMFRIFTFSVVLIGLLYLYKLARALLKSHWMALAITLFMFTSPILVFYANGFMGNVPAIGMVFMAWYCFYKFYRDTSSDKYLVLSMCLVALVGLLRVSLLYTVSFIYLYYVLECLTSIRLGLDQQLFQRKWKQGFILLSPLLAIVTWIGYAKQYNAWNRSEEVFLLGVRPLWTMDWPDVINVTRHVFYHNNLPSLSFHYIGILLFLFSVAFIGKHLSKLSLAIKIIFYAVFIGAFFYIMLFYQSFKDHDYYLLEFIPLFAAAFILTLYIVKTFCIRFYNSQYAKYACVTLLVMSAWYCAVKHRIRYENDNTLVELSSFWLSAKEKDSWGYFHWDYDVHYKALEDIEPHLRAVGIKENDLVLSLPDQSPNITLYMMGQKGYSGGWYWNGDPLKDRLVKARASGIKYLVLLDQQLIDQDEDVQHILKVPLLVKDNVYVYNIQQLTP